MKSNPSPALVEASRRPAHITTRTSVEDISWALGACLLRYGALGPKPARRAGPLRRRRTGSVAAGA